MYYWLKAPSGEMAWAPQCLLQKSCGNDLMWKTSKAAIAAEVNKELAKNNLQSENEWHIFRSIWKFLPIPRDADNQLELSSYFCSSFIFPRVQAREAK